MCVGSIERDNERELQWVTAASRRAFAFCEIISKQVFAERERKKNRQVKIFSVRFPRNVIDKNKSQSRRFLVVLSVFLSSVYDLKM